MPDKLWEEFGECAADQGRDRSTIARDLIRRHVAAWKGRRPKPDHDDGSSDTSR
jgi:metal-responsive CopG/Arc/MetJ family transcriptional regulator